MQPKIKIRASNITLCVSVGEGDKLGDRVVAVCFVGVSGGLGVANRRPSSVFSTGSGASILICGGCGWI